MVVPVKSPFDNNITINKRLDNTKLKDNRYKGTKGNPYLFNKWIKGKLVAKNNEAFEGYQIKYDQYSGNLEVLIDADSILVEGSVLKEFTLAAENGQPTVLFRKYPDIRGSNPAGSTHFYQVLAEGKYSLLKLTKKNLLKAETQVAYGADRPYDEFKEAIAYYLLKPDQTVEKIKLNKSSLTDALQGNQDKLKDFIKTQKLDMQSEAGNAALLQYYNAL